MPLPDPSQLPEYIRRAKAYMITQNSFFRAVLLGGDL